MELLLDVYLEDCIDYLKNKYKENEIYILLFKKLIEMRKDKRIFVNNPYENGGLKIFEFKNKNEVLYIWHAKWGTLWSKTDYSREIKNSAKKTITISDCAATSDKFIILNSYSPSDEYYRIGCQILISGKDWNEANSS